MNLKSSLILESQKQGLQQQESKQQELKQKENSKTSSEISLSPSYLERFGGIARLYGTRGLEALHRAHFFVAGLGGVGTWAAEALARSGVGELTLVDLDDVCVTNSNRQVHALRSTIGQPKISVMADRLRDINPEIRVHEVLDFAEQDNIPELITLDHHAVLDATDTANVKAALVAYCSRQKKVLVTVGSSGGKRDPSAVTWDDLGRTVADPLLAKVRNILYRHYNFARDKGRKFRVDAIFSSEQIKYPQSDGTTTTSKRDLINGAKLDCAGGLGAATMLTGSFGFLAAARLIERYLAANP